MSDKNRIFHVILALVLILGSIFNAIPAAAKVGSSGDVIYDGNGSTGGSVPIDSNTYALGATATVLGNTGNLTQTGYTFAGWNTAANGSGTSYAAGAPLTMGAANVTLYAQWTVAYTVSVSANPPAGGTVSGGGTYPLGATVTVTASVYSGYNFINWTENAAQISTSAAFTFPMGEVDRTLVANFAAIPTYNVTYDGNGSTGGSVPIDSNSYAQGATAIVLGNIGNLSLTKNGYTFTGWNTAADGSGTSYAAGATLTMGVANVTLYAQWTANPPVTYTVSVSANPQAGGMVSGGGTYAEGASVTVTATPNSGYTFINWTEGGIQASTSATYTFPMGTADRTLVAGFAASPPPPSGGGGGGYAPSPISATVTGSVIDSTTGAKISNIPATVTADSHGSDTISMNAAKALLVKQSGGNPSPLSDLSQVAIAGAAGTPVIVSADGTIQVAGLAKGTDNKFDITYDLGNSQKITLGTMEVKIDSSGNATLTTTLIDPYGLVTDEATGKPVAGANITLYYADTERNRAAGKTPDTVAALPIITGFKPDNNQNPQVSDTAGAYSFLAFPNSDYYIVATKVGYEQYTSPTISVEQEIVHWDFKMSPTISGVTRLAGQSRVDTALAIAQAEYTGKIANVILATAGNYPDALTGSVLAYQLQAPILLVGSSDADQEKVLAYMKDNMNPSGTVYILGGTGVVSSAMEAKVTADGFPKITRLGGADRYETSVKIAGQLGVGSGTPIVLVNGENYPDALSISSIAAQMQLPILLVQKDGISDSVSQEIASIKPSKVYIIGGEGAISATVESQVAQLTGLDQGNIMRIGGADRYATSLAVAQYFNLSGQNVCVATGDNFPDALAGSVYAANHNAPIILADDSLSDQVMNYLKGKNLTGATIFGGEAVVSKDIEQQLQQLIGQ